jgi:hypothetical protein
MSFAVAVPNAEETNGQQAGTVPEFRAAITQVSQFQLGPDRTNRLRFRSRGAYLPRNLIRLRQSGAILGVL